MLENELIIYKLSTGTICILLEQTLDYVMFEFIFPRTTTSRTKDYLRKTIKKYYWLRRILTKSTTTATKFLFKTYKTISRLVLRRECSEGNSTVRTTSMEVY